MPNTTRISERCSESIKPWNLSVETLSFLDRIKLAKFCLTAKKFTSDKQIKSFEEKISKYFGVQGVFCSSGSTANHVIAQIEATLHSREHSVVIVPTVTWISSISPWIMSGFNIDFCDINTDDLSYNYASLEKIVHDYHKIGKHSVIFATALIGKCPDLDKINKIQKRYQSSFYIDACESMFTKTPEGKPILSSATLVSSSTYFSHFLSSVEGGFVFSENISLLEKARLLISHGLSRTLPRHIRENYEILHKDINPSFMFVSDGTNFRNTEFNALVGQLNLEKVNEQLIRRKNLLDYFYKICPDFISRMEFKENEIPFYLPITFKKGFVKSSIEKFKKKLNENYIEFRPLISGNLLRHPVFLQKYGKTFADKFKTADYFHYNCICLGLHHEMSEKNVDNLVKILKNL